jgi:hypothetical protein
MYIFCKVCNTTNLLAGTFFIYLLHVYTVSIDTDIICCTIFPQKEHSAKFDSIWLLVSRLSAVDILIYDENPGHLSDQNNIHGHLDQMSLKLHIAEFFFSCGKH